MSNQKIVSVLWFQNNTKKVVKVKLQNQPYISINPGQREYFSDIILKNQSTYRAILKVYKLVTFDIQIGQFYKDCGIIQRKKCSSHRFQDYNETPPYELHMTRYYRGHPWWQFWKK